MSKFDVSKLRDKLQKEEENKGKNKKRSDSRFLNFYDLDFGQQIEVRLLPDGGDSGEMWLEYAKHGPNLKNSDVSSIACINTMKGEKCPICSHSYNYHKEGNKDAAKAWRRKEVYVAQCVVVDSPIEVNQAEDGNRVKLLNLPYGMLTAIKESIVNGTIEDPTAVNFVIKKTKNQGGKAEYDRSFFRTKESDLSDEIIESLSSGQSYLFDLSKELPDVPTADEARAWLENAIKVVAGTKVTTTSEAVAPTSSTGESTSSTTTTEVSEVVPKAKQSASDLLKSLAKNRS